MNNILLRRLVYTGGSLAFVVDAQNCRNDTLLQLLVFAAKGLLFKVPFYSA